MGHFSIIEGILSFTGTEERKKPLEEVPSIDDDDSDQPPCSPGYLTNPASGVTVTLLGQDLWKKFYRLGTEMIITKAGR